MGNSPVKEPRLALGGRVEVRDGDEEWEMGTVVAFEDGIPRVVKDDYKSGYLWDEWRLKNDRQTKREQKVAAKKARQHVTQGKKFAELLARRGFDLEDLSKTSWVGFSAMTAMAYASRTGDVGFCMFVLSRGGEECAHLVRAPDAGGWAPLHFAARHGHLDVAEWLYQNGAAGDVRTRKNAHLSAELPPKTDDANRTAQGASNSPATSTSVSVLAEAGRSGSLRMLKWALLRGALLLEDDDDTHHEAQPSIHSPPASAVGGKEGVHARSAVVGSAFAEAPLIPAALEGEDCAICLEPMRRGKTSQALPCGHCFHKVCVEELRTLGVNDVCPMCRATLPPGPDQLLAKASATFLRMKRKVDRGLTAWGSLADSERKEMAEVVEVWAEASESGLQVMGFPAVPGDRTNPTTIAKQRAPISTTGGGAQTHLP